MDVHALSAELPVPSDDGAGDHLRGAVVPPLRLPATPGRLVDLAGVAQGPSVLFFYSRTGEGGRSAGPPWDLIPGARGVVVAGVSTQTSAYQRELVGRNHVPFDLSSDNDLALTRALALPTFEFPVTTVLAWLPAKRAASIAMRPCSEPA